MLPVAGGPWLTIATAGVLPSRVLFDTPFGRLEEIPLRRQAVRHGAGYRALELCGSRSPGAATRPRHQLPREDGLPPERPYAVVGPYGWDTSPPSSGSELATDKSLH